MVDKKQWRNNRSVKMDQNKPIGINETVEVWKCPMMYLADMNSSVDCLELNLISREFLFYR